MSFESESSLEPGVICSVGGTSGNGLFLVSEPSGFSTKWQRSVNLTEEANMVETRNTVVVDYRKHLHGGLFGDHGWLHAVEGGPRRLLVVALP
ncbi:hypothetical protein D5086_003930 [Populus alba]|uniref:Uncharacterized protein n=1 Tax=Populus alba TaxID=43335 RepID=A0ACC4D708_POPAL